MKAIVFEEQTKKVYFLGGLDRYYCDGFIEIAIDSPRERWELVVHRYEHLKWEETIATDEYTREFSVGEYLNINGENHEIIKVSHAEDGTIFYRIDKKNIIEDEESKIKAESNLAARKEFLKERKMREPEEIAKKVAEELNRIKGAKTNKKWYQFW